ncbi:DUF1772 domain-containing protein [filamentous cyanobacterium CCT1]|nr:DUF1772 domain-containing protein [filamentous cyanobacterium CCT1]PSN81660.1 DUF1772 domain-containing protein [filamentous cyanobacterium CCP4]
MSTEVTFQILLIVTTLLCSLVAGFLFAFATIVMPGIKQLRDRDFIRAFQVIDGMVQNNQPVFVAVWVGSVVASLAVAGLGFDRLEGTQRLLLLAVPLIYMLGVQLSTFTVNVPLNNQLQALNVDAMGEAALKSARLRFEPRWNRWNVSRALLASLTSIFLLVLLFQL